MKGKKFKKCIKSKLGRKLKSPRKVDIQGNFIVENGEKPQQINHKSKKVINKIQQRNKF